MIFVQSVGAGLGGYALFLWFKKARKPTVIGFHAIAGLAGIETLAANIHMSELAADSPVRALAVLALEFFAVSVLTGVVAALVGKRRPQLANLLLALHVGAGLLGLFTVVLFARDA
jgi:glycerol uptake facilitator-like aquaporin